MDKRASTGDYWERDGMGIRVPILHVALMIEEKARWAVELLLAENKEIASMIYWKFDKRILFLTTLKALDTDEKKKFTDFQKIRNKLIHELGAKSLVDCYRLLKEDPKKTILKDYKQDESLPLEDQLYRAVQMLIDDIGHLLAKIEQYVIDSVKEAKAAHFLKGFEVTMLAVGDVATGISGELKKHFEDGGKMTIPQIPLIPMEMMLRANAEAQKRVRLMAKERYKVDMDAAEKEG